MTDDRVPIEDALPGFTVHPLDEGWTPLSAFVLVKALDSDGDSSWSFRTTERLNLEELLGALTVQVKILKRRLATEWEAEGEDQSPWPPSSESSRATARRPPAPDQRTHSCR